VIVKQLAWNR